MKKASILPRFQVTTIDSASSEVSNPQLAATIYAFDVPLRPENPFTTSAGDGLRAVRVIWNFHQPDPAGNAPEVIVQRWNDKVWLDRNPADPLTICRRAFENFGMLKEMIEHGRGLAYHSGPCAAVTNTRMAAVLLALGHPLLGWRRNPQVTTWCFHQAAAADAALYHDQRLYERLPDAAISYAKAAILGHEAMVAAIKDIQFARVQHKGRTAMIGRDMPADKLSKLEQILYRK